MRLVASARGEAACTEEMVLRGCEFVFEDDDDAQMVETRRETELLMNSQGGALLHRPLKALPPPVWAVRLLPRLSRSDHCGEARRGGADCECA